MLIMKKKLFLFREKKSREKCSSNNDVYNCLEVKKNCNQNLNNKNLASEFVVHLVFLNLFLIHAVNCIPAIYFRSFSSFFFYLP